MGSKRRSSDIISLLVSIYGSKDIFVNEYRDVLADRLLHQHNYNTARWGLRSRPPRGARRPGAAILDSRPLPSVQGDP